MQFKIFLNLNILKFYSYMIDKLIYFINKIKHRRVIIIKLFSKLIILRN